MNGRIPLGHIPPLGRFEWIEVIDGAGHYTKLPSLTTAQRNALTAVTGMTIWNSDTTQAERYDGANWRHAGYTALTVHTGDLDAHTKNFFEILRTGIYHTFCGGYLAGQVLTANKLYAVPIVVTRDITADRIAVDVTVQAGEKFRLGIYNDGANLYPGTLVLDAGEVTLAAIGIKAITIALALTKGIYHLAIISDGTPTLRAYHATHRGPDILGVDASNFSYSVILAANQAYGALPDPFTGGGAYPGEHRMMIALRVASLD